MVGTGGLFRWGGFWVCGLLGFGAWARGCGVVGEGLGGWSWWARVFWGGHMKVEGGVDGEGAGGENGNGRWFGLGGMRRCGGF